MFKNFFEVTVLQAYIIFLGDETCIALQRYSFLVCNCLFMKLAQVNDLKSCKNPNFIKKIFNLNPMIKLKN